MEHQLHAAIETVGNAVEISNVCTCCKHWHMHGAGQCSSLGYFRQSCAKNNFKFFLFVFELWKVKHENDTALSH